MDNLRGNVLIVGDGDFSFTAAYANKLKDEEGMVLVTSTLLSQDELYRLHKNAQANVAVLKTLGVRVMYEVDATKLNASIGHSNEKFEKIVFNFPHTGGKSNIKKNRQLLKDFFHSASEVLGMNGQVLVTLARGQGGTPLDNPIRQWHDSWQVIGQAAFSGWMANCIVPFSIENYPQYGSTGFRSLDREFYTKDSFTYFFTRMTGYLPEDCGNEILNDVRILKQIREKRLHRLENTPKCHPVSLVTSQLSKILVRNLSNNQPPKNRSCRVTYVDCSNSHLDFEIIQQQLYSRQRHRSAHVEAENGICEIHDVEKTNNSIEMFKYKAKESEFDMRYNCYEIKEDKHDEVVSRELRATLFELDTVRRELKELSSNDDDKRVYVCHGDVYRRCMIDSSQHPQVLANEMLLAFPNMWGLVIENYEKFHENMLNAIKELLPNIGSLRVARIPEEEIPLYYRPYVTNHVTKIECTYSSKNIFSTAACNQVSATGKADLHQSQALKEKEVTRIVAYYGSLNTHVLYDCEVCAENNCSGGRFAVFDLDALALCRYDIPDYRLLSSIHPEFLDQFKDLTANCQAMFKPIGLYPPLFRHDLSFWEKRNESINEMDLIDIIYGIARDAVTKVMLMNVWTDPDTGLISKCYRVVYQSLDRPLSHSDAHALQNAIRLKVDQQLGVTLR